VVAALLELATPRSAFGRIARALRRIRLDYARALDVNTLAREAGMSVSTPHANFKAVTAKPRLRNPQIVRLQKTQALVVAGYARGRGPTCRLRKPSLVFKGEQVAGFDSTRDTLIEHRVPGGLPERSARLLLFAVSWHSND
jgi:hypothetical protein